MQSSAKLMANKACVCVRVRTFGLILTDAIKNESERDNVVVGIVKPGKRLEKPPTWLERV